MPFSLPLSWFHWQRGPAPWLAHTTSPHPPHSLGLARGPHDVRASIGAARPCRARATIGCRTPLLSSRAAPHARATGTPLSSPLDVECRVSHQKKVPRAKTRGADGASSSWRQEFKRSKSNGCLVIHKHQVARILTLLRIKASPGSSHQSRCLLYLNFIYNTICLCIKFIGVW
jgi:hypothetical protein